MPSIVIIISIILQKWLDKDEFIEFFKIYGIGLVTGILLSIIFGIINNFFKFKVHYLTIILKAMFLDGLLFSLIICVSFFYINKLFMKLNSSLSWINASIYSFAFISGTYSIINIVQSMNRDYPDNPLYYIPFFSLIFFVSMLIGLLGPKFLEEYDLLKKILWAVLLITSLTLTFSVFYFLNFYNYIYIYLFIVPFGVLVVFFEINEFRYFRT
jgi:MFS family permease